MSSKGKRREPWRSNERHHCAVCNAWMGSDRQSILLHENGKKHIENVEKSLQEKRKTKMQEEKNQKMLMDSLKKMEQAALQSHLQQDGVISHSILHSTKVEPPVSSRPPRQAPKAAPTQPAKSSKKEKQEWEARKKRKETTGGHPSEDEKQKPKRRRIEIGEGHYEKDETVYLQGEIFTEILEEELPVQIWTGSLLASAEEKRLPERDIYWKNALVVGVAKAVEQPTVHVAYLASPNDAEETLAKNVPVDRIRMVMGSDENLPKTVEEARLIAMGGEEIHIKEDPVKVDETTGLGGWSTVTVKKTTAALEAKEERSRLREKRKEVAMEEQAMSRQAEARRLEEAKVSNADDSALGAYDVWGKGGYKGVDITNTGDSGLTVADTAKKLATGKTSVAFKKKKKTPSNRNRRTTSADDE